MDWRRCHADGPDSTVGPVPDEFARVRREIRELEALIARAERAVQKTDELLARAGTNLETMIPPER